MTARWFDSVTLMVLENTGWSYIQDTKFFDYFSKNGLVFSNYTGIGHPSGPNYRAWLSGHNWSWNEFDNVKRPNLSNFVDYKIFQFSEFVPAQRHNPFLDMAGTDSLGNSLDPRAISFFDKSDFTIANLASINYLGLDDKNNAHSASLDIADGNVMEAAQMFETLLADTADSARRKLFLVFFDEGFWFDYLSNHVFAGAVGTGIKPGSTVTTRLNHFNLAQFLADNFGVTNLMVDICGIKYAGRNLLELP